MWWERRIDSLVGGRIDSLVGGRIAIRPYMCDTTLVLGIRWLHFSLFTFHHIPKLIRLATLFTLHSSFFTLFTIVAVLRGESCGEVGGTLPSL